MKKKKKKKEKKADLISKRIVRVSRHLMTIRTLLPSLALSLHPERTDVSSVAFVIGCGSC